MKKTLILAISAMIIFSGCGSSSESTAAEETTVEAEEEAAVTDTEEATPTTEQPAEEEAEKYVEDEVVNEFITNYNAISESPIEEISNGNIRTKFYVTSYGYYLELLHANDTDNMSIRITETNDTAEAGTLGMRDVFHDCIAAIDSSISDDDIYAYFDEMANNDHSADETIGGIKVLYFPDTELSSGHHRGNIQIDAPER